MVGYLLFVFEEIDGVEPGFDYSRHAIATHVGHFLKSCISIMLGFVSILVPSHKNFPPHLLSVVHLANLTELSLPRSLLSSVLHS